MRQNELVGFCNGKKRKAMKSKQTSFFDFMVTVLTQRGSHAEFFKLWVHKT